MKATTAKDMAEEEAIVDQIYEAIIDQRLTPGTKLSESELGKAFKVSRMRARRAIFMLADRGLINRQPNKGAFIASPSEKQARDIFDMRLLIEPSIAKLASERAKPKDIRLLEKHLKKESAARAADNRRDSIKLSGQFHTLLAQVVDNEVMLQVVRDLITQSSLIIGIYDSAGASACREEEHAELVEAIRTKNGELAHDLMLEHIHHIRDNIDFDSKTKKSTDIVSLFS
ncbi:GntR family transcriptional regulator [Vibrio nigripulchritudo]|uniref:GntR family transcriptional regulator n=1 Tax=Vibrio nigripulchritudo TaxID=28173 RepID=UPI0003B17DE7|nr:GntR family transcriptional regulator [Vibrio nigripulchritudo]CCN68776.1 putative Transcriptional regulator, GntR family [Vibrio nigripulchritudo SFn118]